MTDLAPFEPSDLDALADDISEGTLDDAAAERAMRALCAIDRELARWQQLHDTERQRLDAWLEEVSNPLLGRREFFERCLEGFTRANHERTGAKSVKLPSGTAALRKTPDRVEVVGDAEPPERFARVSVSWDKNRTKEDTNPGPVAEDYEAPEGYVAHVAVDHTGAVVDGVVWLLRTDPVFTVRPRSQA